MRPLSLLVAAASVSFSLGSGTVQETFGVGAEHYDWDRAPHPDATGHLIFNSVVDVLQLWPNSLHRHGHGLIAATIPPGTILYHGRGNESVPAMPDWLAFDFEHSYMFARGNNGHVLTFMTNRALKLVYFDGAGASKMTDGSMDSQDIVAWRSVDPNRTWNEFLRISALCEWARKVGVDGFVRMEFHFEVMQCDFFDGLDLVTSLNTLPSYRGSGWLEQNHSVEEKSRLSSEKFPIPPPIHNGPNDGPGGPGSPGGPGRRPRPEPAEPPVGWKGSLPVANQAIVTGKWHDRPPGETRVRPDFSRFVTFYDPTLSSLVEARRGQQRMQHRLLNISASDIDKKMNELEDAITRDDPEHPSGVDWASVTRVVIERYADRLERFERTLKSNISRTTASSARMQLLIMLTPYLSRESVPSSDGKKAWLAPIAHRCASSATSQIPKDLLTPQERLIHTALEETLHELCRRLVRMWDVAFDIEEAELADISAALRFMKKETAELIDWLDWSVWVKCRPACGEDEMCYIPMWPFHKGEDPDDMTPRCIPYPSA